MKRFEYSKIKTRPDIVYVVDSNLSILGGLEESVRILCRNLQDAYSIVVLQPGSCLDSVGGVPSFYLTEINRLKDLIKKPRKFFRYIYRLDNMLKRLKPRIIHTQGQASFFIVAFLKRIGAIPCSTVLIHTERGLYTKYGQFVRHVFYRSLRSANLLITTTEYNKSYWADALNARNISLPMIVIPNTAGEAYESIDSERVAEAKKFTIGFAGRYCKWKGWDLAEAICEKVSDKCPRTEFEMAVSCVGESAKNETQTMFERMSKRYGARFKGIVNLPANEMSNFYYDIDVFILTSNPGTESFGRTLVEAMSRNTAVLSTNAGGAVEVVGNNDNILNTAEEFADRVYELSNDHCMLESEKRRGLERVKKKYALKNNISAHHGVYNTFLVTK